ncbi:MAG: hypothetical protein Q9M37_06240 [Desulfonauticus sp.]|nr:hypothetical protein [Desulfonauticus sp.]
MTLDDKQKCYKPKSIEKEACIFVEGKLDQIIVELLLKSICSKEVIENIQIFQLGGKAGLKYVKKMENFNQLKAVLVILDKDEDYRSTSQTIDNFFKDLPKQCQCQLKFISPPDKLSGKELEEYIIEGIKHCKKNKLIEEIKKCIDSLIKNKLTSEKKLGKKILFTYFLLKDTCTYDGLSLNRDQFQSCIKTSLDGLVELKNILENFIKFVNKNLNVKQLNV